MKLSEQFTAAIVELRVFLQSLGADLHDIKNAIQSIDEQNKTKQDRDNTPRVIVAEVQKPKTPEDKTNPYKQREERRDWIRLFIETLTLFAVAFYGYMAVRQWREQIAARHKTESAVQAAQQSVGAALQANIDARNRFVIDQRPYIWVPDIKPLPIVALQILRADIFYANYGKSPAINQSGTGKIFFGEDAMNQAYKWFDSLGNPEQFAAFLAKHQEGSQAVIPPGLPPDIEKQGGHSTILSDKVPTQDEVNFIAKNDFSAVIALRFQYYDLSGNRYWTDVCVFHFASTAIGHCKKHNEIH